MTLLVHNICSTGCRTLGPGIRFVIWTQGCPRRCKGCITPESQPLDTGRNIEIETLTSAIINDKHISGITISGGEPFLQAKQLKLLLEQITKARPELNVIIYTGYLIEELNWQDALDVLSKTDLLIDGPYVEALNDGIGLRGSSNQRLHFLTNRLVSWKDDLETGKRKIEIHIYADKIINYGIPIKKQETL